MHGRDTVPGGTPLPAVNSTADSASAHKLLNTTLIGILAQPESVEPYVKMLAGIRGMVAAHAGAIYHFPAGAAQATPIAGTGDMSRHTSTIQNFADSLQQAAPAPSLWLDDKEAPDLFIKAIQIGGDIEQEWALLVLICDDAHTLRETRGEFFETLLEGFAGIFRATRQAQVNRRRDLQKERATISRELHDSLAQSLTYLKIQASRMQSMLRQEHTGASYDRSEVELVVHELRDSLNVAYRQLRELMTTFRLTMNGEDFGQAIEDSVGEFEKRSRIAFDLDNRLGNDELTVDEEMQVLHIVREALSNIVRHAHARRAKVALRHCDGDSIRVTVNDDGVGIDESQRRAQHLGLIIMQERSRNLGGEFSVGEQRGGGTEIRVTFKPQKFMAANHRSHPVPNFPKQ
jgi:nitrate/nitrite-specific signal transduction histidine kinase